jgi:hypothetical protein
MSIFNPQDFRNEFRREVQWFKRDVNAKLKTQDFNETKARQ